MNRKQRRNIRRTGNESGFIRRSRKYIQRVAEMGFLVEGYPQTWKEIGEQMRKKIVVSCGIKMKEFETMHRHEKTMYKVMGAKNLQILFSFRYKTIYHAMPWETPTKAVLEK